MKIAIISDLHLNKTIYKTVMDRKNSNLPFRHVDFMRSFKWMVDKCIQDIKPNLIVINGDVYDNPHPSNEVRGFFSSQLHRLYSNNIRVIILTGNHDVLKHTHSLADIKKLGLGELKVIDQFYIEDFENYRLVFMPYSLDIEQKKTTVRGEFQNVLNKIKSEPSPYPLIFFGHFGVKRAILNSYYKNPDDKTTTTPTLIKKENNADDTPYFSRRAEDVECEWLDDLGAEYIFLGDFHKHQILNIKTHGFYVGSIEKGDMNEIKQPKGFMVFDSEGETIKDYGKSRFIEYPNCRPMLEIRGTIQEIRNKFGSLDYSKYMESIVKLVFFGNKRDFLDFASGIESLKKEIQEKLNPIHIFTHNPHPHDKNEEEKISELTKEIMEKGHITDEDVLTVIKEMITETVKDKEEQSKVSELAVEIYQEVMGK